MMRRMDLQWSRSNKAEEVICYIDKVREFTLVSKCFHKLLRCVKNRRQKTHLMRCAGMLKHHAIKKLVTAHFVRWMSNAQRRISGRLGECGLVKVVVFPRNQDFLNLCIRYLAKWRLWLRHVRQRRVSNVKLLQQKTQQGLVHRMFLTWERYLRDERGKRMESEVSRLVRERTRLKSYILELERRCEEHVATIDAVKRDVELLEERNKEQKLEFQEFERAVTEAVSRLDVSSKSGSPRGGRSPSVKALELGYTSAREGDGDVDVAKRSQVALLELVACIERARRVMQKLRSVIPENVPVPESLEDTADGVCLHVRKLSDTVAELSEELHSTRYIAVYLRTIVKRAWEKVADMVEQSPRYANNPQLGEKGPSGHLVGLGNGHV
ncbi:hypothetical protein TRVL_00588 [Trypanosoma vivax]|nr:hypothetical protein TRVL_00588 [Trypanosoma vivax]